MEQHMHRSTARTVHGWRRFVTLVLALMLALAGLPIAPVVTRAASTTLVISQFQTKGTATPPTVDEFVELHNVGPDPVDLNGYRARVAR